MEAREIGQRAQEELEALQQRLEEDQLHYNRRAPNRLSDEERQFWEGAATTAGRRAAALYAPFLRVECLVGHQVQGQFEQILDEVKKASNTDGEPELEDAVNPALYWDSPRFDIPDPVDLAREIIYSLPKSPGQLWFEEWFQKKVSTHSLISNCSKFNNRFQLKDGIRKQRSDIAFSVAHEYHKIFGITGTEFQDRAKRPDIPEVQEISEGFMHIGEEDDDGELKLSSFFRDECIVKVSLR